MVSNISGHDFFHSFFERVKIANVLLTFLFFVFVVIFCFFLSTPPKQFLIFYSLFVFCFSYFCIYFIIVCSKSFLLSFFFLERIEHYLYLYTKNKNRILSFDWHFKFWFQVTMKSPFLTPYQESLPFLNISLLLFLAFGRFSICSKIMQKCRHANERKETKQNVSKCAIFVFFSYIKNPFIVICVTRVYKDLHQCYSKCLSFF